MPRLLAAADWNADTVRDDLCDYVVDHLDDLGGVWVVDEIGFGKKGSKSAGVARQYCGTARRVDNCRLGVFLAYATPAGHTFDRELSLPKSRAAGRQRCAEASAPGDVELATRPEFATRMLTCAFDAGVSAAWVTGDEAYGQLYRLHAALENQHLPYLLAVSVHQHGHARLDGAGGELRAAPLATWRPLAWRRISVGQGARGRWVDAWARAGGPPGGGT